MPASPTPRHTHLSSTDSAEPTTQPVADAQEIPDTHSRAAEDPREHDGDGAPAAD